MARHISSGHLIADRRFAWACASRTQGDELTARDLLCSLVEELPHWAPAWFELGSCYEALGQSEDALQAYTRALLCDPHDLLGAALHQARLQNELTPAQAPPAYVRALFDDYAARFDAHLVDGLHYHVPELIRAAVMNYPASKGLTLPLTHVLDVGCGTGLVGHHLRGLYQIIDGADLSPQMIEHARQRELYAQLHCGDGLDYISHYPAQNAQALIAADVFVYIGALEAYFAHAARLLTEHGLFIFSIQESTTAPYLLGPDLRYAHSCAYIEDLARAHGFELHALDPIIVRYDQGHPLAGRLALLHKKAAVK